MEGRNWETMGRNCVFLRMRRKGARNRDRGLTARSIRDRVGRSYFGVAADRDSDAHKPAACTKEQGGMDLDVKDVGEPRPHANRHSTCLRSHLGLAFSRFL